jgi:hypothetical protein
LELVPELHLPGLLSLDLTANYLPDLDCAALENLAQVGHFIDKKMNFLKIQLLIIISMTSASLPITS